MSSSFRRENSQAPADYRTPSPPLRHTETISPVFPYPLRFAPGTPPAPEYEQITPERFNGFEEAFYQLRDSSPPPNSSSSHASKLAKSARQFRKLQQQSNSSTWVPIHERESNELDSRSLGKQVKHNDTAREEAELLLNFTREARFAVPVAPFALEESSQHRSISFNSYHQTRPSLSELAASAESHGLVNGRPATQNGTKNLWKEEAHVRTDTPRSVSRDEQSTPSRQASQRIVTPILSDELLKPQSDEPEVHNEAAIADHLIPVIGSDQPMPDADQHMLDVGSRETAEVVELAESAESATSLVTDTKVDASDLPQSLKSPTEQANLELKKMLDTPSICASCNFARNTASNEPGSELTSWINCDGCRSWFHFACAGFKSEREVRSVDKFRCKPCKPVFGPTTFVRKSARAHTSIDYAGLNEGVIKTSDTDPEHHYVKDFKNGKRFTPESFARMRPEYVTAQFFERGDGMREPVVIPAALNPRPAPIPNAELDEESEAFDQQAESYQGLHDRALLDSWLTDNLEFEVVQDQGQDALDMVIPRDLTVRKVAELYGPEEKLEVIDVKSQNGEDKPWTLRRWADYYESTGEKVVRNVISLEVSQSKLGRLIRRPKVVRDLDLQDSVWPNELQARGEYPKVQFYCLMSVADCYTDFHIDFGGSSVYYHILRGNKTFFFIPPTEKHLKQYEEWCNSPAQNWTFLGDQTNQCYRVDLSEGDTMLIPAGWIHAVWTPSDSLVIGGNFLTRLHYPLQIRVAQIEKTTNVARKFRYPYFQKLLWYSAIRYMDEDPIPENVIENLNTGQAFPRDASSKDDYDAWGENSLDMDEYYHARHYPRAELDGFIDLCDYLLRTALIAAGYLTDGISIDTRNAVKRSIPKGHNHGEPLDAIKKFACWCSWKRGNETIPYWAYSNYLPECAAAEGTDKKMSIKTRRKLDHEAANQAIKTAPDRQSTRTKVQPQTLLSEITANQLASQAAKAAALIMSTSESGLPKRKLEETPSPTDHGAKRQRLSLAKRSGSGRKTACDACRKSRRACRHGLNSAADQQGDDLMPIDPLLSSSETPSKPMVAWNGAGPYDALVPPSNDGQTQHEGSEERISVVQIDGMNTAAFDAGGRSLPKPGGRTKACKDCRKSKRRCVHDELGNEDPRKLAEAAIPRPTAKRKKLQQQQNEHINGIMAPIGVPHFSPPPPPPPPSQQEETTPYSIAMQSDIPIDPLLDPQLSRSLSVEHGKIEEEYDINQLIDPALFDTSLLVQGAQDSINLAIAQSAEEVLSMLNTSPLMESKYDPQLQSVGSPPVNLSLVSPPSSTKDGQELSASESDMSKALTPPSTNNGSRHSSRAVKVIPRFTPESGTLRQPSLSSGDAGSSRESTSPITTLPPPPTTTPLKLSKSRAQSELDADEASLKLIREMQAQDLGLRRRA